MLAYVMIGAPGSGKSTHASKLKADNPGAVIICGDTIRGELYGDEKVQGQWHEIEERGVEILEESVGRVVIMDGTHYRAAYRKKAIALLNGYGYDDIRAVIVNTPLEVCLQRNAKRTRNVPVEVIEKMHSALQVSLRGVDSEGFSMVDWVLPSADNP